MAKYDEWLTDDKLLLLAGWARQGLIDDQIAGNMGIARSTLSEWKKKYSALSDALKKGKEVVDIQVENALLKRALGYTYDEVTKERIAKSRQDGRHEGKTPLTEKQWIFSLKYFNYKCCYCLDSKDSLTKDHLVPLAKGGQFVAENIVPCCQSCNSSKKDRSVREWFRGQSFFDAYREQKISDYVEFVSLLAETEQFEELVVTKSVEKQVVPDTVAQIFWLKNRCPDRWRERRDEPIGEAPTILVDEP